MKKPECKDGFWSDDFTREQYIQIQKYKNIQIYKNPDTKTAMNPELLWCSPNISPHTTQRCGTGSTQGAVSKGLPMSVQIPVLITLATTRFTPDPNNGH